MTAFDFARIVDVGAVKVKRNAWLLNIREWGFAIALERLPPPSRATMERPQ